MDPPIYSQFQGGNPFGSQAKLLLHRARVEEYFTSGDTTPIFMEINPTNVCNLKCKWCITEKARGKEKIALKSLEKYFYDFAEAGGKAVTFSGGGEPTCYPYFSESVKSAKAAGLHLGLMTNGVFKKSYIEVIGENFDWARFSVDTLNRDNYHKWKGYDYVGKVIKNIENLSAYSVKTGVNCNIGTEMSVDEAKALVDWVGNGAANYMQFRPVLPRFFKADEGPELNMPVWDFLDSLKKLRFLNLSDDKRSDLTRNNGAFSFRSCEGHFFEPILDATGEIKICMYHPRDDRFSFGNIYHNSFNEIWNSEKRKSAINFIRGLDYSKNCQVCCKLAEPNKLIDFLSHPEECPDLYFL